MRLPSREELLRLGRFVLLTEGIALTVAAVLGAIHSAATRTRFLDSYLLVVFLIFLFFLAMGVLSGPGLFLSRPKFAPVGPEASGRWREWLSAPQIGGDREFFDLVLYVGLGFLLLAIATGIGAVLGP
jgi:MFS-type transporter involved in bile tolerance (Atg22 family)